MTDSLHNQRLGKYHIQQRLGDGGMGSVYLAHDTELKRDVAIKVMHPHFARQETFQGRFRQEAQAMAQLSHAGIVQVHDFGESGEWLYIVMELLRGGNLQEMLDDLRRANKWMTLDEALRLGRQIALALEYAHQNKVLHRDIKPANIMVKPTPGDSIPYQPVITDLGLAKLGESAGLTQTGTSMGTPAYMSPEQGRGELSDARSDVYSLGVLLFELVCGERPFAAATWSQALQQHTEEAPPPPANLRPDIPQDVAAILLKALQKEPNERFASAAGLAAAIDKISSDDRLQTVPPTAIAGVSSIQTQHQQSMIQVRGHSVLGEFPSLVSSDSAIQLLYPDGKVETFTVSKSSFTIGRGSNNDLVLDDAKTSRHHARIETDGEIFRVTDLDSANGTAIGNSPLLANVPEIWPSQQALRIGLHYLRLVPAQSQSAILTQGQTIGGPSLANQPIDLYLIRGEATVEPGQSVDVPVVLVNKSEQVAHFDFSVDDLPPEWLKLPQTVELLPGGNHEETITIQPPRAPESHARSYDASVCIVNQNDRQQTASAPLTLTVKPFGEIETSLRPQEGRSGQPMQVEVANRGNIDEAVTLTWQNNSDLLDFQPSHAMLALVEPGEVQTIDVVPTIRKRPWIGGQKNHPITVQVASSDSSASHSLNGTVNSRGFVPPWMPPLLLALLVAIGAGLFYGLRATPPLAENLATPTPTVQQTVSEESLAIAAATATPRLDATSTFIAQQTADAQNVAVAVQQTTDAQATVVAAQLAADNQATSTTIQQAVDAQSTADAIAQETAAAQSTVSAQQTAGAQAAAVAAEQTADAQAAAVAAQQTADAQNTAMAAQQTVDAQAAAVAQQTADAQATAVAAQQTADAQNTAMAAQQTVAAQQTADAQATAVAIQTRDAYDELVFQFSNWGSCNWVEVGAVESHNQGAAWGPDGSFLTQFDLDGDKSYGEHDAPIVGRARFCKLALSVSWTACNWVKVGAVESHNPGPAWGPDGSFLTQFDLDGDKNYAAHDAPIVGWAKFCKPQIPITAKWRSCQWVDVGATASHNQGNPWGAKGSFLTQFDLDGGRDYSSHDAPYVGKARYCQLALPPPP